MTANYYDVLFGYINELDDESTMLCDEKEVADFILTHDSGYITEEDGVPLLAFKNGKFEYCNDIRYRAKLIKELRKNEGFDKRYQK